jgi:glucose/arabinose dehydrogenase
LSAPTAFDFLPDGRVLFVEQFTARVRVFTSGTGVQVTPVITVAGVNAGGERGLLGVAVDPRFPSFPYLLPSTTTRLAARASASRATRSPGTSPAPGGDPWRSAPSRYDVVDGIPDAASNHNGGTVRFGLDGLLYASLGDDASSCSAQTPGFRGVILRLEDAQPAARRGSRVPRAGDAGRQPVRRRPTPRPGSSSRTACATRSASRSIPTPATS